MSRKQTPRDITPVLAALVLLIQGSLEARPARAQSEPTRGATSQGLQLEEVIVTAQLREERLQDVPISVQVVSGDVLTEQNLNSLTSVSETVPSVHVAGSAGRVNEIVIRGVGGGNTQAFDQPVGIFSDGIYHGRSRFTTGTFLDLERVEILKGPQSTFFGNNAIAGAFNIVTRKPTASFEGWTRALYGEAGQYALEGAIGGPITDSFAIRAAATFNGMDGWLENVNTREDQPEQDNMAGRVTLQYSPGEALDVTLKVEGSQNRDASGLLLQLAGCPSPAPFAPIIGFCAVARGVGAPTGLDNEKNSVNDGQESNLDTAEAVLTLNYRIGDHLLTSVTGYHEYQYKLNLDADLTPIPLLHIQAPEEYDQISQELRIASPTDGRIEYLAGLYYQRDNLDFAQRFAYHFLNGTISGIPPFAALIPYLPLGQETSYSQTQESYAAFGSVTWKLTDALRLTGGLRGTWVDKNSTWNQFFATAASQGYGGLVPLPSDVAPVGAALGGAFGLGDVGTRTGSRHDHAWMPSARIEYKLNADALLYTSYARGFLAGGFNGAGTRSDGNEPFDPEYVDAYEIGLKSEWFARRLLVNLSVFHSEYTDLQVTINETTATGGFINQTRNAATSISKGVEVETQWKPIDDFGLTASITYLDAYYSEWLNSGPTQLETFCRSNAADPYCAARFPDGIGQQVDRSGTQRPYAPQWSGSLAASYSFHLPGDYEFTTELSAFYSDDYYQNVLDEFDFGYTRLDGRLSFQTPDGRWAIDVIGKNLTDKIIPVVFAGQPATAGSQTIQKQQPRNFALQARYRF